MALERLLDAAKAGEIRGLAYVIKAGPGNHLADIVGDYKRNPGAALQASFALERELRGPLEIL